MQNLASKTAQHEINNLVSLLAERFREENVIFPSPLLVRSGRALADYVVFSNKFIGYLLPDNILQDRDSSRLFMCQYPGSLLGDDMGNSGSVRFWLLSMLEERANLWLANELSFMNNVPNVSAYKDEFMASDTVRAIIRAKLSYLESLSPTELINVFRMRAV